MEGRVFALDLEELVGFLLAGNMSHKAEMGEHGCGWRLAAGELSGPAGSTQCLEGEPWETTLG